MSMQSGPGNEPKKPEGHMPIIAQSAIADRAMGISILLALQLCIKFVVWPDRVKVDNVSPDARLKFLVEQLLREIKNMPTQGVSETDETSAKQNAIRLLTQVETAIRNEIARL